MEFVWSGERNGTGVTTLQADFAAGEAAQGVGHARLPGFPIPFKDVVRAEVEALEILNAGFVINGGKPGESFAEITEQLHRAFLLPSQE
jgi:hypothetical protein